MRISDQTITIRCLEPSDGEAYCDILSDDAVSGTLLGEVRPGSGIRPLSEWSRSELEERFQYSLVRGIDGKPSLFGVEQNGTQDFIGSIGCYEAEPGTLGLSYWLSASMHGKGLGTRMLRLFCPEALKFFKRGRLVADVAVENPASIAALRKAGFEERSVTTDRRPGVYGRRCLLEWQEPKATDMAITT